MTVVIRAFVDDDMDAVDRLWRDCFPDYASRNAARVSIPEKLRIEPDSVLVAIDKGRIVGSAMHGYDGHRGWLYGVAVASSHRRCGIGERLVREAEARLTAQGCVKINLQVMPGNDGATRFYARLGYAVEPRISMGRLVQPTGR